MAAAHEHLTPEQERLEQEYSASYAAQRLHAADPEFMAFLRKRLAEQDRASSRKLKTKEEFFAQTEHLRS